MGYKRRRSSDILPLTFSFTIFVSYNFIFYAASFGGILKFNPQIAIETPVYIQNDVV